MVETLLDRASWLSRNSGGKTISESVYPDVIDNVRKEMEKASERMHWMARFCTDQITVQVSHRDRTLFLPEAAKITFLFCGGNENIGFELKCKRGGRPMLTIKNLVDIRDEGGVTTAYKLGKTLGGPEPASESELEALSYVLNWLGPDWN